MMQPTRASKAWFPYNRYNRCDRWKKFCSDHRRVIWNSLSIDHHDRSDNDHALRWDLSDRYDRWEVVSKCSAYDHWFCFSLSSDDTETCLIWLSLFIWLLIRGYDEKMAILVKWSLLSNSQWKFYNFNIIFIIHRNWRWQNAKRGDYLHANKLKKELRQVNCQHK